MRLKHNVVMIIILSVLFTSICIGIATIDTKDKDDTSQDEIIENVIPDSFCQSVTNGEKVPNEVLKVVTDYMDDYYLSLYTLELQDTTKYFISNVDGQISDASIKLMVETRKLYNYDFGMSNAYYKLNITNYQNANGKHTIEFLEDDSFSFNFLNGISSEVYDIENKMVIEKTDDGYKISEFEKNQGYYTMFKENEDDVSLTEMYDFYFKRLQTVIENENYNKGVAASSPYTCDKAYVTKYDRDAAKSYAQTYYHSRNDKYYNFTDEGGNCQNFASQMLVASGLNMDEVGEYKWYYNDHLDYDPSWVHVQSFYEYCNNNEGTGLVCDINSNIYYAEPGDIIQVGISSISHTTIVSQIVDGHILLNSNSLDMKDYPLEAFVHPVRKLIKILGSNS